MSDEYLVVKTPLGEYLIKKGPSIKYSESDEWVNTAGNVAVIGVSDYAQKKLRQVVNVELPETGRYVSKGESVAIIESVKAVSDVYAPLSGKIVEVNKTLTLHPELVNTHPYGDGWLFKVEVLRPEELRELLTPEEYANKIMSREK
ncbi:MAG: glycine cleavage system protein GcvH [Sulfolobales archaeon]